MDSKGKTNKYMIRFSPCETAHCSSQTLPTTIAASYSDPP